jgi:outer membrane receptor protein involved in Fe transport
LIDLHNGGAKNKRDTIRLAFGAEGDIGNTGWEYTAYYQYGETQRAQVSTRQFNAANFKFALDARQNADGTYSCKDVTADAFGCVPINVFGIDSITPEMANWIIYNPMTFSNNKLHVAAFDTTGDISIGDYTFSAAAGIERKEEDSFELPDGLQQKGLHGGNQIPAEIGNQDSTGMYVELLFPLIEGVPFVDSLVMETAFRQDDYSTIGKTNAQKVGLLWTINDEWRVRSVVGEAVRAPSISDLFAGASQTWTSIPDPCAGLGTAQGGSTNPNVIANCNSVASVANAVANGSFDAELGATVPGLAYSQLNTQNIYGMVGGNKNVGEETADTTTFGIVWTPTFAPNLSVTLDSYEIEIEDVISQLSASVAIRKCFEADPSSFPNAFCDQHTRFPTGHLESWSSYVINQSFYKNEGMDLAIDYSFDDLGPIPGALSTSLVWTRLDTHTYRANDEDAGTDYVGEIGHPEDKAKLRFLYTNNDLTFSVDTTYIGDVVDDLSFNHGGGNTDNAACTDVSWLTCELADWQVGNYLYVDLQLRYQFTDGLQAWVGVDNLTDKQPPFLPGGTNNGETGTYTASGVYRSWDSQYWYVGFKYKM